MQLTTACVLLYGDYPDLARRCLSPLSRLVDNGLIKLRVGCNDISQSTRNVVADLVDDGGPLVSVWDSPVNLRKYPMMRRMFGLGLDRPIDTPLTMWFDDDSYITDPEPAAWLGRVESAAVVRDMIGSVYTMAAPHSKSQKAWIAAQPWYAGLSFPPVPKFVTGGWWVVKTEIIYKHDWPPVDAYHDGGDVMFGELMHQQGYRIGRYNLGVAINADAQGRESKAARRGDSGKTPRLGSTPKVETPRQ